MSKIKEDHKKNLLIVFVKNLVPGKVKSRLALTTGYNSAVEIYADLMHKIHDMAVDLPCDKQVAYSDSIEINDIWETEIFDKTVQQGTSIGTRMYKAFSNAFEAGYENVILIGSDIINLNSDIIIEAFSKIQQSDLVLGPATDGGYYLIGLKSPVKQLFENKDWSTNKVFIQTLKDCIDLDMNVELVPELPDLDKIKDFQYLNLEDREKYLNIIEKDASKVTHPYLFQYIKKGA